jgi:HEAT repeat protein
MKAPIVFLSLVAFAVGTQGLAQDEKPPDYSKKSLVEWIAALKNKEDILARMEAQKALGPNGPYAKIAIPALINALKDEDFPVDWDIANTLASYGPSAVPSLRLAIKRPEATVKLGAVRALGLVRPRTPDSVPDLIAVLKDTDAEVRKEAAVSLGRIGRAARDAVPALITAIQDEDKEVRQFAAAALGKTGQKSMPAIQALVSALKDSYQEVRESAAKALEGIGPEAKETVPALIEAMQDLDLRVRQSVVTALGNIGPGAKSAIPDLIWKANRQSAGDREDAIRALGKIGPDAKEAVPSLIKALEKSEQDASFRSTVVEAIGGIGKEAKAAIPSLTAIAKNLEEPEATRKAAASAIASIDPALAVQLDIQVAYLSIRLREVPDIKPTPRPPLSQQQKNDIKALIQKLSFEKSDFGIFFDAYYDHRTDFTPLPDQVPESARRPIDKEIKPLDALRNLVEKGPDALPFLLDALDDDTPTKIKLGHPVGAMSFGNELDGNLLNPVERRILSQPKDAEKGDEHQDFFNSYTVRVGDLCFVAIGQIVGRPYYVLDGGSLGGLAVFNTINSPVQNNLMRARLRAIWSGDNPTKKLLESLLLDYATEGKFNGKSVKQCEEGSIMQTEAAMRLLFYYPKETAGLIAARLQSLDVQDPFPDERTKRDVKNGVRTGEFIKAVAWCREPEIQKALNDIAKRTDDKSIKEVLKNRVGKNP